VTIPDNVTWYAVLCKECSKGAHTWCEDTEVVEFAGLRQDEVEFTRYLCACPHKPGLPARDRLEEER